MKRLLLIVALLWPLEAAGQDLYRPKHVDTVPPQAAFDATHLSFTVGTVVASGSTTSNYTQALRLVCTASCFVGFAGTNWSSDAATAAQQVSGFYLPSGEPATVPVRGGEYVLVIGESGSGTLYVRTMTK